MKAILGCLLFALTGAVGIIGICYALTPRRKR